MKNRNMRSAVAAVIEAMEDRRLMSVTIPAGYVKLETIQVDAKTSGDQGFTTDLTVGASYFVVSGKPDGNGGYTAGSVYGNTAGIGVTSGGLKRRTDALKFDDTNESGAYSRWTAGNAGRFTFAGVADGDGDGDLKWGGVYQADHIYGQTVIATDTTFGVEFRDTPLTDNSGFMTLTLYRQVVIDLQVQQLPEETWPSPNEEDTGGMIPVNHDDDDLDDTTDYLDDAVANEDELVEARISVPEWLTSGRRV